ncbi:MAG: glycosyltransferase [Thermoproteota archaeon]|nr:glycosyltransferase [Thermoproteota archaeon]
MKILHLSHESLPDWRIEKAAISTLNKSHEVAFAGMCPKNYSNDTFSEIYSMVWTAKARFGIPFYWRSVKKQLAKIIREARPDIVHAHNLFSAKMISEFHIPFVYDDHEYWPIQARLLNEIGNLPASEKAEAVQSIFDLPKRIRRNFINNYAEKLWTKWESEIVSSHPTITVSSKIAEEMKTTAGKTGKIFVVPNYPLRAEVGSFTKPLHHPRLSCTYAGGDAHNKEKYPHLNREGLPELFGNHDIGDLTIIGSEGPSSENVRYVGYLKRDSMYMEMSNHSIGLVPFKKHWSHAYLNPNKAYEYAHAGLYVMCTSSLTTIRESLKDNCSTFEGYETLVPQLGYFKSNPDVLYDKRLRIFEFAQANLIWEKNEQDIFRAYQVC